jgi:hypothetical protein
MRIYQLKTAKEFIERYGQGYSTEDLMQIVG